MLVSLYININPIILVCSYFFKKVIEGKSEERMGLEAAC